MQLWGRGPHPPLVCPQSLIMIGGGGGGCEGGGSFSSGEGGERAIIAVLNCSFNFNGPSLIAVT